MSSRVIKKIIAYYCDECGEQIKYSGSHEMVNGKEMWIHYCPKCHNRYDFRVIYPIHTDVDK